MSKPKELDDQVSALKVLKIATLFLYFISTYFYSQVDFSCFKTL